jgi:uridine kinase
METDTEVVDELARRLDEPRAGQWLRVAVDGVTAAGKTTFADLLAAALRNRGVDAIRVTMDSFHNPREIRHRQGRMSSDGYYEDAYDFAAAASDLLAPFGLGGSGRYRPRVHDLETDRAVDDNWEVASEDSVLIVDGSFLQRAELTGLWDVVVYLDVDFDAAAERGVARDAEAFGGADAARDAFAQRYHAACRRYVSEVDPLSRATIVIDNNELGRPRLVRG